MYLKCFQEIVWFDSCWTHELFVDFSSLFNVIGECTDAFYGTNRFSLSLISFIIHPSSHCYRFSLMIMRFQRFPVTILTKELFLSRTSEPKPTILLTSSMSNSIGLSCSFLGLFKEMFDHSFGSCQYFSKLDVSL